MWTRRAFLKSGGLAVFAAGVGGCPLFLQRTAQAAAAPLPYRRRKVLVNIFQRGAMDGVMAVTPFRDPHLQALRPQLVLSPGRGPEALIDLDGTYGLHPALAPLHPFYADGRLAIVHGVGSPVPTRSHFDAQAYMENGTPGNKGTPSGWLNRAVGALGHDPTPFTAVALTPAMPMALYGEAPALAIADLDAFGLAPNAAALHAGQGLEALYAQTSQALLQDAGADTFEAVSVVEQIRKRGARPRRGARYPKTDLGQSLRQIAQLIKAEVGLEVAFAESLGWDTHVRQGAAQGSFARQASNLARALAAFWTDLEGYHDEVVVMTMTEFGRTVHQNGSGGTDHGRASCLFVLGNAVAGGQVHGQVPILDPDALEDGRDLPVTTDFRSVFSGVSAAHLGLVSTEGLFPGWAGTQMPLVRG